MTIQHLLRAIAILTTLTTALSAADVEWKWSTHADFDKRTRDRYLDSESQQGGVRLVHNIILADEMGAGYNDFQPIHGKACARKTLMIDSAEVDSAMLLVGGNVANCEILVNGKVLDAKPLDRPYWNGDFDRFMVPPAMLRQKANEFVFRARDGKTSGSIRIERSQSPNRSAVSHDGGYMWDSDHLGEGGYIDGEFQVRLNLARYAPEAWIASPVLDLASSVLASGLPAASNPRIADLTVNTDTPPGTGVRVMVRTGATPDGYEENWSRWYAWPSEKDEIKFQRFAQWRLLLATAVARATPVVKSVAVKVDPGAPGANAPGPAAGSKVSITKDENQEIVRSSYEFAYSDYNGNLRVLRDQWKLADVVASGQTELHKLVLLRKWVRERWVNGWDLGKLNYVPSWDARLTLNLSGNGNGLGMCTHYATTYVQCSQALGYTSRSIFRGHALSESWSNEYGKWMVMDAGMDPNDKRKGTYHFMRKGVPLSELEVHKAFFIDKKWDDIDVVASNASEGSDKPEEPLGKDKAKLFDSCVEMFLPLRNNFIDHREPEEPEHGMGYFKFLGHLFWKDKATPEVSWTDFFTTREADIYWTLNQAQIFLRRADASAGGLRVMLDTVTPNFAGYEYRFDGGQWVTWNADPRNSGRSPGAGVHAYPMKPTGGAIEFDWKLHPGANTIEAMPFNKAGLKGIVSRIAVAVE